MVWAGVLVSALAGMAQAAPVSAQALNDGRIVLATNRKPSAPSPQTTAAFKRTIGPLSFAAVRDPASSKAYRIAPIARDQLAKHLAETGEPGDLLLYVHGFNNTAHRAIKNAAKVARDIKFQGPVVVFSWPSIGRILPTDYLEDVRTAAKSAGALLEVIQTLHEAKSASRIHVLAHSLGSDVFLRAMLKFAAASQAGQSRISEVIFCSPDVDRGEFTSAFSKIRRVLRGATLWGSDSDAALLLAGAVGRGNRAGRFSNGALVIPGLDTVDVSAEASLFDPNHDAYEMVPSLFADLNALLQQTRMPPWSRDDRKESYTKVMTPAGPYWRFVEES
jgi:esterase/lipase superfamily enzyme